MTIFQDVTLGWDGQEHTVPADQVMKLIAVIENEISINELLQPKGPPLSKFAAAYAAALQYAGHRYTGTAHPLAEDIYQAIFKDTSRRGTLSDAVAGLVMMMVPPDAARGVNSDTKKKATPQPS
jgi:hypothetical protein